MKFGKLFPCINWLKDYSQETLRSDLVAAVIVTIMLIPQSLAYSLLAGLPAQVGLYASILPLVVYAIFGTSRTLSVGPVAVASLMTAASIQSLGTNTDLEYLQAAILLALLSGFFLLLLGIFRFGFLANFLSHPVVSGFISASGIIIALSQFKHILGIEASGDNLVHLLASLFKDLTSLNVYTLMIGISALIFLFWSKNKLKALLQRFNFSNSMIDILCKSAPVFAVVLTSIWAYTQNLSEVGVALIGEIPAGLPSFQIPIIEMNLASQLIMPAILISIIGYVESVSVGKTLATKRRQKIIPDQELIGLGSANIASALSGAFPVTGGFSRSVVNFDAGAKTQAASFMTAIIIAFATVTLTDYLAFLPKATLAATIIVAVVSLIDFSILKKTWNYSISDFIAVSSTILITLLMGVEIGVSCGVFASITLYLYNTSKPHIAEVGQLEGTEHFRNVKRHEVITQPFILSLRVDERLYFANASYIEDEVYKNLAHRKELKHVVLMCTAVNGIDISALDVLEAMNERLKEMNIGFHLSEVKGPIMDLLEKTHFISHLNGKVFLTQNTAVETLIEQEDAIAKSDF